MARVAIIGGRRTPFVKAGTVFSNLGWLDLSIHALKAVVEDLKLDSDKIDEVALGAVLLDPRMPNFAREAVLWSGLSKSISAHAVSNNCISGIVAANFIAEGIRSGRIGTGIAGGAESMSNPALTFRAEGEKLFLRLFRARGMSQKAKLLLKFRLNHFVPQPPSPKEPSTGLTMGQHTELIAKEYKIARETQDQIAFRSHSTAARARDQGVLKAEIAPLNGVESDNLVRADTTLERLAKLKPVFDRSSAGTLTAGNSSPLTDGASAVCLMAEDVAKREGRKILGYLDGIEFAAIDPKEGLLMAPAIALPRLLTKQKVKIGDVDLFEIHEAFGAQVAANLLAWKTGWKRGGVAIDPIGEIPTEKINVNGGSIAIGHPFAATGGRLIMSAVNELQRSGKQTAVISVCAAGAMAAACLIRRE